jgi:hypothetical protein
MAYEKMPCAWDSEKDLIDRLQGTICRYDGVPYLISVESKKSLLLSDIVSQKIVKTIDPSDPKFDVSSAEIGYINFRNNKPQKYGKSREVQTSNLVVYLQRIPSRRYRQGLNSGAVVSKTLDDNGKSPGPTDYFLLSSGLRDSLMGVYPTPSQGMGILKTLEEKEIALSQSIALSKMESGLILVYCRTVNIGWIAPGDDRIVTPRNRNSWVYERMLNSSGLKFEH